MRRKNNLISAALYVQKIRKCRSNATETPLLCLSGWFIMFQTFLKWFITNQVRVGHSVPSSSSFARDGIAGWVSVSSNFLQRQILEPLNSSSREAQPGSAISLFTLLVLTASSQLVSAFYLLCSQVKRNAEQTALVITIRHLPTLVTNPSWNSFQMEVGITQLEVGITWASCNF